MIRRVHGYRLLVVYRGHATANIPAIEDLLLRVARLVEEVPEIFELDLNPIIALPPGQGRWIVDAHPRGVVNAQARAASASAQSANLYFTIKTRHCE